MVGAVPSTRSHHAASRTVYSSRILVVFRRSPLSLFALMDGRTRFILVVAILLSLIIR